MVGDTRSRKPRWPLNPGNCLAYEDPVHPADPLKFTGYCLQHEPEYQMHRLRYNNWTYNYRHKRTMKRPPSKAEYFNSIRFSPLRAPVKSVSKAALNEVVAKMSKLYALADDIESQFHVFSSRIDPDSKQWRMLTELINYSKTLPHDIKTRLGIQTGVEHP